MDMEDYCFWWIIFLFEGIFDCLHGSLQVFLHLKHFLLEEAGIFLLELLCEWFQIELKAIIYS